jgi:hypothetical protein
MAGVGLCGAGTEGEGGVTPFAQKLFRNMAHLIDGKDGRLPRMMAGALCFEISEIIPAICETVDDLAEHPTWIDGMAHYDHGGLLLMPAPVVWLEFIAPSGRVGLLLNEVDEEIGVNLIATGLAQQHSAYLERRNADMYVLRPQAALYGLQDEKTATHAAALASVALMLINAPRGVIKHQLPLHKGLAREAKRYGVGPIRHPHKIVLDVNAGDIGGTSGTGPSSEKAFHYCRSHIRRIAPDRSIVVRGHWKGNPALGIARGDYVVRGDRTGMVH